MAAVSSVVPRRAAAPRAVVQRRREGPAACPGVTSVAGESLVRDDPCMSDFGLGDPVPAFALTDTEGREHAFPAPEPPPATVLIETCNHCPYVVAWNPRLRAVAEDYQPRGVRWLAISSNDPVRYPADSPERMAQFVREQRWPIPYAHDGSQDVARALGAERTPHVFVLDAEQRLAYRGAPDGDHQDPGQDAAWLRSALDAVLAGRAPEPGETPARGCSVKWRD